MSHTNHTTYYELPQYIGSDIINPLVDTNGAYETIDTTMHNIATEAAEGTTNIATLQSKVGNGVFQTTAQNATDAVNELVGELNTADTGIKARLTTAESDIDTLQSQMVTAQGNIVDLQNNKADASTVSSLADTVATKADASTVSSLADTVATKADASTVSSLADTVATKADSSTVSDLANVVATKADASSVGAVQTILEGAVYSSSPDGTKTFGQLAQEAIDKLLAVCANHVGKKIVIESILILGIAEYVMDGAPVPISANLTSFNRQGLSTEIDSANNKFTINRIYVAAFASIDQIVMSSGSVTVTSQFNDIATGSVSIYYHINS